MNKNSQSANKKWLIYLAASLFPFYTFIEMNFLNSLSIYLIKAQIISTHQLGTLSASYTYADALMLLPVGILLDNCNTKKLILTGLILSIIGGATFASSNEFIFLIFARFISGLGHAFALLCCFRLANALFPPQKQAFLIGMLITIALLGGLVAQTPLELLAKNIGLHKALWCNVLLGVLVLTIIFLILPNDGLKPSIPLQKNFILRNLKQSCLNTQNWLCGFYTGLMGIPIMLFGAVWGTSYLMSTRHLSSTEASVASAGIFIGTIVGSPLIGLISDKLRNRKYLMLLGAVLTTSLLILLFGSTQLSFLSIILIFFFLGLFASSQILGYPVVAESNKGNNSTAMGFMNVLVMAVIATYQLLFGFFWGSELTKPHLYSIILLLLALTIVCSILITDNRSHP